MTPGRLTIPQGRPYGFDGGKKKKELFPKMSGKEWGNGGTQEKSSKYIVQNSRLRVFSQRRGACSFSTSGFDFKACPELYRCECAGV